MRVWAIAWGILPGVQRPKVPKLENALLDLASTLYSKRHSTRQQGLLPSLLLDFASTTLVQTAVQGRRRLLPSFPRLG